MKTYHWFANRKCSGAGVRHASGTVEAQNVQGAWAAVDLLLSQSSVGPGNFKLSLRRGDRWFANRHVVLPSTETTEA